MVIALEDTIGCVRGGVGEELDVYGIHRGIRADSTESRTTLIARYTMDRPSLLVQPPPPPVILSIPRERRSDVEPLNNFATIVYPTPFDQVNNGVFLSPQLVIVDHFDYFNSKTDELKVDRADWENRGRGEDRVG